MTLSNDKVQDWPTSQAFEDYIINKAQLMYLVRVGNGKICWQ